MGILGNYKFTDKKHPEIAIMAAILGAISLVSQILVILICYQERKQPSANNGMTVLLSLIMAITGLVLAIVAKVKRNTYPLFPIIGMVVCGVSILFTVFIIVAGVSGV